MKAFQIALAALTLSAAPAGAAETKCGMTAVEIVSKFSQLFFVEKKWHEAFMTYVAEDYTQHNPMAQDGRAEALKHLGPIFDANPGLKVDIKRIFGDDSHVAVHYHSVMQPGTKGFAAVDMFRVKDCKIVEHWDVIQPMPEKSANPHPMF
ncbi:MAG: nuclear transport factor 2 family protein [Sphingomonadales bacterium]|nr:nuclear transport factor 2 family protein [Sphingomonadales bacterium]